MSLWKVCDLRVSEVCWSWLSFWKREAIFYLLTRGACCLEGRGEEV